jgi:hypothetical protein
MPRFHQDINRPELPREILPIPISGLYRMLLSSSWFSSAENGRSAARVHWPPKAVENWRPLGCGWYRSSNQRASSYPAASDGSGQGQGPHPEQPPPSASTCPAGQAPTSSRFTATSIPSYQDYHQKLADQGAKGHLCLPAWSKDGYREPWGGRLSPTPGPWVPGCLTP